MAALEAHTANYDAWNAAMPRSRDPSALRAWIAQAPAFPLIAGSGFGDAIDARIEAHKASVARNIANSEATIEAVAAAVAKAKAEAAAKAKAEAEALLVPGGSDILVTERNKHRFLALAGVARLVHDKTQPQIEAMRAGVCDVLGSLHALRVFSGAELERVLCGYACGSRVHPAFSDARALAAWQKCTEIRSAQRQGRKDIEEKLLVDWFWEWVQGASPAMRSKLMAFWSSDSQPGMEISQDPEAYFNSLSNAFRIKFRAPVPEDEDEDLSVAPRCRNGHATVAASLARVGGENVEAYSCDRPGCGRHVTEGRRWRCAECNYDVCPTCRPLELVPKGAGSKPKKKKVEHLPSSHTCFRELVLPRYRSKEQLWKKLEDALAISARGFGMA